MPCGFLVVDKPAGMSSRDVTSRMHYLVRKATGLKKIKVGHVGTLDPLATGVLAIAVGRATRLSDLLHELPKQYVGRFRLGLRSDTEDITGVVEPAGRIDVTEEELRSVLPRFTGEIEQRPPAVSAKKVDGKRAYKIARKGGDVELPPVRVRIESIELTEFAVSQDGPEFGINVCCGSGTYVRSLGRDIAAAVGSSAVMTELRRLRSGPFHVDRGMSPEVTKEEVLRHLMPAAEAVTHFPPVRVDDHGRSEVYLGRPVSKSAELGRVALLGPEGELLAIGESNGRTVQPRIVLPANPSTFD